MVETGGSSWHQTNRGVSIYISIYLVLLVLVTSLSKVLHARPHISSILPEAGMVIAVGIIAGVIINLSTDTDNDSEAGNAATSVLSFSPTVFFVVLLPPIIFNSGYRLHRDLFFRHAVPICLYACVGTTICTFVVAGLLYAVQPMFGFSASFLELAAFGALISATDPVSTLAIFEAKKVRRLVCLVRINVTLAHVSLPFY
jgi:sodium/hydrogen exchanger 8